MIKIRTRWRLLLVGITLMMILIVPIAVYRYSFDGGLSRDRDQWAAMGSAMSGIYGPILSAITLGFLIAQLSQQRRITELQERTTELQERTTALQQETAVHIFDQAHIQDARADIEFYLMKMVALMNANYGNVLAPPKALREQFTYTTREGLLGEELKSVAYKLNEQYPHFQANWSAFNTILYGLMQGTRPPYHLQLTSAQQKANALLSYETCVALDNYLYCISAGRVKFPWLFNTALCVDD